MLVVVVSQEGPVSYTVDVGLVLNWKRHTDQMRACDMVMLTAREAPQPAFSNSYGPLERHSDYSPSGGAGSPPERSLSHSNRGRQPRTNRSIS